MQECEFESKMKEIEERQKALDADLQNVRKQVIESIRKQVVRFNLTAEDIFADFEKKSKVQPKYRNPAGEETWSGRGKAPVWFTEALTAGISKEEMLIK